MSLIVSFANVADLIDSYGYFLMGPGFHRVDRYVCFIFCGLNRVTFCYHFSGQADLAGYAQIMQDFKAKLQARSKAVEWRAYYIYS